MSCTPKRAALFDLDGTLMNSLRDISIAMNLALRSFSLPEFEEEDYKYLVGNGVKILAERAVRERQELRQQVQDKYQQYYGSHNDVFTKPYDGIQEALASLHQMGIKLCVLSNKPHPDTVNVISHYFPDIPFTHVQGQKPEFPIKPDPAAAIAIAREIGVSPEEFLYFGDTAVDVSCAAAAGMTPVGVLWGFRKEDELRQAGASIIINTPSQIPSLFVK